ncbi:MAG: hypothetical protein HYR55_12215 [Acidobacteria bacterium]|nr:hypothetical protein [Acidobacteriota bacterium]
MDGTIKFWDVAKGTVVGTLAEKGWVESISWSPDESKMTSGSTDYSVKIWDLETSSLIQIMSGHADTVWSVAWSPDGSTIASGSEDWKVNLWNAETGALLQALPGHMLWVRVRLWGKSEKEESSVPVPTNDQD